MISESRRNNLEMILWHHENNWELDYKIKDEQCGSHMVWKRVGALGWKGKDFHWWFGALVIWRPLLFGHVLCAPCVWADPWHVIIQRLNRHSEYSKSPIYSTLSPLILFFVSAPPASTTDAVQSRPCPSLRHTGSLSPSSSPSILHPNFHSQ
jgi:hypothetical protein